MTLILRELRASTEPGALHSIVVPAIRQARKPVADRRSIEESVLDTESEIQLEYAKSEFADRDDLLTATIRTDADDATPSPKKRNKRAKDK